MIKLTCELPLSHGRHLANLRLPSCLPLETDRKWSWLVDLISKSDSSTRRSKVASYAIISSDTWKHYEHPLTRTLPPLNFYSLRASQPQHH